jgi:hypothetical protein
VDKPVLTMEKKEGTLSLLALEVSRKKPAPGRSPGRRKNDPIHRRDVSLGVGEGDGAAVLDISVQATAKLIF